MYYFIYREGLFQVLSATLLFYNRKCGMRTSGALFIFWLLLILAGLPQLRTEITNYKTSSDSNTQFTFGSYVIYYLLLFTMFILNCFADFPPKDTPYRYDKVCTWKVEYAIRNIEIFVGWVVFNVKEIVFFNVSSFLHWVK